MALRQGNDRSVKTIRFLQQYAKLCAKHDRRLTYADDEIVVETASVNEEMIKVLEARPEV